MLGKYEGCLVGMAVCDALGTAVEFLPPGSFPEVTGMRGGGKYSLCPGEWTDDTSMALCLAESLLHCGFDPHDQMRRYLRWYEEGHLGSTGECFDIGKCTVKALGLWRKATCDGTRCDTEREYYGPETEEANGNGSLMRLAPIPLRYRLQPDLAADYAAKMSRTTHGGVDAVTACRVYTKMIIAALNGATKDEILAAGDGEDLRPVLANVVHSRSYMTAAPPEINAGGWVVKSLEAALWAFAGTSGFAEGALKAVNLGDDADTVACIYGQLAGAYYGIDEIPSEWVACTALRTLLLTTASALHAASEGADTLPDEYTAMVAAQEVAESWSAKLVKGVRPGPRMFRSLEPYEEMVREATSELRALHPALAEDYVRQWERHRETLKIRFGM